MKKYILVEGDYNDGDCVEQLAEIDDEKRLKLTEAFDKIIANGGQASFAGNPMYRPIRWDISEDPREQNTPKNAHPYLSDEEIKLINSVAPYHEYGIHSITGWKFLKQWD